MLSLSLSNIIVYGSQVCKINSKQLKVETKEFKGKPLLKTQCAIWNCLPIVSRCTIIQIYQNLNSTIWRKGEFIPIVYKYNAQIFQKWIFFFRMINALQNLRQEKKKHSNWTIICLKFFMNDIFCVVCSTCIFIARTRH